MASYYDAVSGSTSTTGVGTLRSKTTKQNNDMTASDFLNLMVMQLKNQDFMNPADEKESMAQMAQFTMLQQMQEMAEYTKTVYAASTVGKTVTVAKFDAHGKVVSETGVVQGLSINNNTFTLLVNGEEFDLSAIMEVHDGIPQTTQHVIKMNGITENTAKITWKEYYNNPDKNKEADFTYEVYISKEPIEKIEQTEDATLVTSGKNIVGATIKDLDSNTLYFVNVVATDKDGNKFLYDTRYFHTKAHSTTATEGTNEKTPGADSADKDGTDDGKTDA